MNIHVGNLAREVDEKELREAFEAFGHVAVVKIIRDRGSGTSKGFAFVEMPSKAEGQAAMDGLNRKELSGRTLDITEARAPGQGGRGNRPRGGGGRAGGRRRGSGKRRPF